MGISARYALLFFCVFSLQIASHSAQAQVKITSVTGASNFIASSGTSQPIIYGGIAGTEAACGPTSPTSTCNNCTGIVACNERRIHTSLVIRINFEVTGDLTGVPRLTHGTALDDVSGVTGTTATLTKGGTGFLETTWGDLCSDVTGNANCDLIELSGKLQVSIGTVTPPVAGSFSTITLTIFRPDTSGTLPDDITCGLSPPQDGICTFKAYPGDEKIYMEDLDDEGSYPDVDNVPFKFLRVFYSTVGFDQVNYATAESADLDIENDGAVSPEKIDGLANETRYYFKTAMVDAAYNVAFLTSEAQIDSECGGNHDAPDVSICPHTAVPSNVLGLLEKDFNCFVTTAAYGSAMAEKVQDFRDFRNRFLVPKKWGRSFIFYYYDVGPKAARWMWEHPWSKPVVRAALWPVWLYAVIANGAGIFIANITFFLIFALVAYSIYALRTRQATVKVRREK